MAAIDTNVLVRLLVEDDPAQCAAARQLFEQARSRGEEIFVPLTVVLELEWVLRARYGFDKPTWLRTLAELLSAHDLHLQQEPALEVALSLFRDGVADFADALHLALVTQAVKTPWYTFDRRAARMIGAQAVQPIAPA